MAIPNFAEVLAVMPTAAPKKVTTNAGKPYAGLVAKTFSAGAAVLYGVNGQAERADNTAKFGRAIGNGSKTVWDEEEILCLENADLQATITAVNCLRVVVEVDGTPLVRVGSAATPGAGEFKVADNSGTELTIGTAPSAGAVIKVHVADAADINSATAPVADQVAQRPVYDFMGTGVAAATISNS